MANPGGAGGTPAQGNSYPVKTEDVYVPPVILAPLSGGSGGVIAQLIKSLNPPAVKKAGDTHVDVSKDLTNTALNLIDHANKLSQNWSGQAAQNAINQFQQLHDTAISLSQASARTGSVLQWLGDPILPWYKNYQFSNNLIQDVTEGEAVDILTRLGNRLVMANNNLPNSVNKTQLPGSVNNGTPGTTNGVPNGGVPYGGVPYGGPPGGVPGGGVPGAGGVNGGLPGAGHSGTVPGVPGTGTVPGAPGTGLPGTGTGMPGTGTQLPGTTHTAGYTGSVPPPVGSGTVPGGGVGLPKMSGLPGGPGLGGLAPVPPLGGLAGDAALGGPGAAGLSDGAGALNPEGAAAGEAAAMGAQDGAAAEGMAGLPMGGAGGGQGGEKERKREAWMNEDDEIWGLNEVSTVPPVIGAA